MALKTDNLFLDLEKTWYDPGELVGAVEEGFRLLGQGEARVPDRMHMPLAGGNVLLLMPAATDVWMGVKIVSVFPENRERGLAIVQGLYVLMDGRTGETRALMDGAALTALRTPAASALATRLMARPGSSVLGIFGAGVQALGHARTFTRCGLAREVLVCAASSESSRHFADRLSQQGIHARAAGAEEVAARSDVICTCTTSATPLFPGELVRPGTHINAVGSFRPETRELDTICVRRARVVVDSRTGAMNEAGDLLIPLREGAVTLEHIRAELADVVLGRVPGRETPEDITLFKSTGHAIEDLICAVYAFRVAS